MSYAYGWRPDRPDHRDLLLSQHVRLPLAQELPARVDLLATGYLDWPVYDQGQLGSCTANAIAGALRFELAKQGLDDMDPARLWIYYQERKLEGNVGTDAGAEIRDGLKVVSTEGWPAEVEWPYDVQKFATAPTAAVDRDALADLVLQYLRVPVSPASIKQALASGFPVVVGFECFPGIESDAAATTGMIPQPRRGETSVGGHAVLCVGYDSTKKLFKVRNSWAASWGDGGHGYVPETYLGNPTFAQDFWSIQKVSVGAQPQPTDPCAAFVAMVKDALRKLGL